MKALDFLLGCFVVASVGCSPADDSEAVQRDRLFQRFLKETDQASNSISKMLFDQMVVHPSFGLGWDEVPAPTIKGPTALAGVEAFVATNGWNMHTGNLLFTYGLERFQPIRALPWRAIKGREFSALTHEGILYVMLSGWHHDCNGIAFNPKTNRFPGSIGGFKAIGAHWYVWKQTEIPVNCVQKYE